jgi:hypothetical protein
VAACQSLKNENHHQFLIAHERAGLFLSAYASLPVLALSSKEIFSGV